MIYRRLLTLVACLSFAPLLLQGQNLSAPYPQRNALDYLRHWGDSTRNNYTGRLAHWGSRIVLSTSGGVAYMAYPKTVGVSAFSPLARLHLGWWFTPVSAIELGGSFSMASAEVNYLFNFSKFATRNAGFERFSMVGLMGLQLTFPDGNSQGKQAWGAHAALRGVYHLRGGMNFFIEPRLTYYGSGFSASELTSRGYLLAPSLALGMQLRVRNIDRYDKQWFNEARPEYRKMAFALKTNLLYGGVARTPNLGAEFLLSNRFTLEATVGLNPFKADSGESGGRSLKHSRYQLAGRYWFDKSFNGAFLSLHASYADYDLMGRSLPWIFSQRSSDGGYKGDAYGGGVSVGYLWRLGEHLGLEAELGAGYMSLHYNRNLSSDYFGLTKASLALVWLFNVGDIDWKRVNFFPALFAPRENLRSFDVALKTNLLYGAYALTPNLGAEIALSNHMTLEAQMAYNPWKLNSGRERFLVHTIYSAAARYWTRQSFDGFFTGAHLLYSDYNISHHYLPMLFGQRSSYYRFQGNAYGAGISVGYLWRVGARWGIEAEVGGGYLRMNYDKYDCVNCGRVIEKNIRKNYYGPTKAALSLVYMLK